jgi:signal transduction histidine kinase
MLIESPADTDTGYQGRFENMLLASIASGILTVDANGNITSLTTEAERLLQLKVSDEPLTLAHLPATLQAIIREVEAQQRPIAHRQILLSSSNGEPVKARVNATCSQLKHPAGVVVVLKADTPIIEMERNLRRLDRLASAGLLSASMAHEIKNALVTVRTFTELLLEKNPDAELAGIVRREVGRVDTIVSQLLRFAAPSLPAFATIHLHKVLDHSVRVAQHGSRNKQIAFHCEFQAASDALNGDDHQLEQAFVNLMFNAVESIPESGSLTIATDLVADGGDALREESASSHRLRIRITDTGSGIAPDQLNHIFEPFFTTKESGTGLGLAVTRRIIREHHGTIHVESFPGKGTTFVVLLPVDGHGKR